MAAAQMTAAASSSVFLPSFEGLKPSTIKVSSASFRMGGGLTLRSTRGLVVKAATTVAPKVNHYLTVAKFYALMPINYLIFASFFFIFQGSPIDIPRLISFI